MCFIFFVICAIVFFVNNHYLYLKYGGREEKNEEEKEEIAVNFARVSRRERASRLDSCVYVKHLRKLGKSGESLTIEIMKKMLHALSTKRHSHSCRFDILRQNWISDISILIIRKNVSLLVFIEKSFVNWISLIDETMKILIFVLNNWNSSRKVFSFFFAASVYALKMH